MISETITSEITERIAKLKDSILATLPTICTEQAKFYTQAYNEYEDSPVILKRAYALEKTLKEMTIFIEEGELIIGNQAFCRINSS